MYMNNPIGFRTTDNNKTAKNLNIKQIKAAIYVRVSTEEQARDGLSITAQIKTLTQYCELYNINIYNIYKDLGLSGKSIEKRESLNELLKDAKNKHFDIVIVWKISRLSRSLKDLLMIIDFFECYNIDFISYSEKLDTSTPVGRMTLQLLGSIAEFERNTIVENVKLGLKEFANRGGKSTTVLGYDNINKKLIKNTNEAEIVIKIFQLYIDENYNLSKIAKVVNENGYRTKRGNLFKSDSVAVIIDNPVYIGYNRHNVGKSEEKVIKGEHEAIIDFDIWEKASKKRIFDKKRFSCNNKKNSSLLYGLLICPLCGKKMFISYSTSNGKNYRYYKCNNKSLHISNNYKSFLVSANKIEEKVFSILIDIIKKPKIIKAIITYSTNSHILNSYDVKLKNLNKKIKKQEEVLEKYFILMEKENIASSHLFINRIANVNENLKLVYEEREKCMKCKTSENISIDENAINSFLSTIQSLDRENYKCVLNMLFSKIILNYEKNIDSVIVKFRI